MKEKLYFAPEIDENTHPLSYIKDSMKEYGIKESIAEETVAMINFDMFWCTQYQAMIERQVGACGEVCKYYDPRNGTSGICKYNTYLREGNGKFLTIKL